MTNLIRYQGHLYRQADLTAPDILWYEDKDGNKLYLDEDGKKVPFSTKDGTEPDGAVYQVSQFPSQLTTSYLRLIQEEDVSACSHPEEDVLPFCGGGWKPGIEGRQCKQCGGRQTKDVSEPWPEQWESGHSIQIMEGHSGWPEDLVLAMANDGYPLGDAILIVATLCERCLNVMCHYYDPGEGYALDSEEYEKSGTECDLCDEVREEVTPEPEILQAGPGRLITYDDLRKFGRKTYPIHIRYQSNLYQRVRR